MTKPGWTGLNVAYEGWGVSPLEALFRHLMTSLIVHRQTTTDRTTTAMSQKPIAFERAAELIAMWLARFRDENAEPTDNDLLIAGHLAGALWANDLLNTTGETWVKVESLDDLVEKITPENRHTEIH